MSDWQDHTGLVGYMLDQWGLLGHPEREVFENVGLTALWRAWEKHNPARSKFSTYACRAIGHAFSAEFQKIRQKPTVSLGDRDFRCHQPTPPQAFQQKERTDRVREVLGRMDDRQAWWVYQALGLETSEREMAQDSGLARPQARKMIRQAVKSFRKAFSQCL